MAVLSPISAKAAAANIDALRRGLHDLGYDETRDFDFALRFLGGNLSLAPEFVAEIVALNPDIIVASTAIPVLEARQETSTIPIETYQRMAGLPSSDETVTHKMRGGKQEFY